MYIKTVYFLHLIAAAFLPVMTGCIDSQRGRQSEVPPAQKQVLVALPSDSATALDSSSVVKFTFSGSIKEDYSSEIQAVEANIRMVDAIGSQQLIVAQNDGPGIVYDEIGDGVGIPPSVEIHINEEVVDGWYEFHIAPAAFEIMTSGTLRSFDDGSFGTKLFFGHHLRLNEVRVCEPNDPEGPVLLLEFSEPAKLRGSLSEAVKVKAGLNEILCHDANELSPTAVKIGGEIPIASWALRCPGLSSSFQVELADGIQDAVGGLLWDDSGEHKVSKTIEAEAMALDNGCRFVAFPYP